MSSLWRGYEAVFAALYESNLRMWGGDEGMASWLTALGLGGAVVMNMAVLGGVIALSLVPLPSPLGQVLGFSLVTAVLVAHYVLFLANDRYRSLARRFGAQSVSERRRSIVVAWVYVGVSYTLPIIFAVAVLEIR